LCHDLEKHDLVHEPVDMIFNQMALHHVEDVDLILKKFYQLLKPGGVLVIADLYTEDGTFHDHQSYVHDGFDPLVMVDTLRNSGFVDIRHQECYTMFKPMPNGDSKAYPVFLLWGMRAE
jgi:ubiquinone/menaquinone biosynthesis C-methylase UbiE